jgi:hypothetical protein
VAHWLMTPTLSLITPPSLPPSFSPLPFHRSNAGTPTKWTLCLAWKAKWLVGSRPPPSASSHPRKGRNEHGWHQWQQQQQQRLRTRRLRRWWGGEGREGGREGSGGGGGG